MELPFALQVAYHEEIGRAKVPGSLATGTFIAAPTIIHYGTPEQPALWLRPMLRADTIWAQGFSEPDAGSDLPALRCRAERAGDHYVVTGAKVWSSAADIATHIFALVRTGTQESRDRGITYLVIEVDTPGISIAAHPRHLPAAPTSPSGCSTGCACRWRTGSATRTAAGRSPERASATSAPPTRCRAPRCTDASSTS